VARSVTIRQRLPPAGLNAPPVRVLFLTHRLPYAPNRGDRLRAFHQIEALRSAGHQLDVLSLVHDRHEAGQAEAMRRDGIEVVIGAVPRLANLARGAAQLAGGTRPLTLALLSSRELQRAAAARMRTHPPDVVFAFCSSMARYALEPPLDRVPLAIDMVDADSAKWADLAGHARWPKRWIYVREAHTLASFEALAMRQAAVTLCVNERERRLLAAIAPDARIEVVENGVDLSGFGPPAEGPPRIPGRVAFTGVMNYEPNAQGALWFAREVWPDVRRSLPRATFAIVGAHPTPAVRALHDPATGIEVTGAVPAVPPFLWEASLAVAPLHTARGVQNKVLEAVAAGLPCVVTPAVREGLPPEVLPACTVAGDAPRFAEAVVALLSKTPEALAALAAVDLAPLAWERRLARLPALLEEAARTRRGPPEGGPHD
jgi:polysaccharide biosynthesis protein PslH